MSFLLRIVGTLRTHKKKSIAAALIVLLVAFLIRSSRSTKQPEYVTQAVTRTDLRQTVEAVGTITSERELDLKFGGIGVVSRVYVKEGDHVSAGQRLAELRAGSLAASVAAQAAALQSAQADLRALEEGTRPEEIAIAEADLQSKTAALEVAKATLRSAEQNVAESQNKLQTLESEASTALTGQVTTAVQTLLRQIVAAENGLSSVDDVVRDVDVQDAIIKDRPDAGKDIQTLRYNAEAALNAARSDAAKVQNYSTILAALDKGRTGVDATVMTLDALFSLVNSIRETSSFSNADRESLKSTITTQRTTVQSASAEVASARTALLNASASYDSKLATERASLTSYKGTRDKAQSDILTYQASIQASEAQLALKRAGARQTDIDSARARVRQAQANLARTQADLADMVLTAPTAGVITHVNIKPGESLPSGPAVAMLGISPFRVEMFVSEIDIPKVVKTQSGSIELDAFRGTKMKLQVSDVDPAATDKDGVSKYRVVLDFVYPHNELKIGMTGDAEIETGFRSGVLTVPRRAVLEGENGRQYVRVLASTGALATERDVTLGMEGGSGDVEVTSGLEEGQTVVVLQK